MTPTRASLQILKGAVLLGVISLLCVYAVSWGYTHLDRQYPLNLARLNNPSIVISDAQGRPLNMVSTSQGAWRLPVTVTEVDPLYIKTLVAYEDKRFWTHGGVDISAVARALIQNITNGRVVSGASTLTMQTARLLEPRPRTLLSKFVEAFRAFQLEAQFSKLEILNFYLSLAPYGGRLEGVRSAALAYFDKEPRQLSISEIALLVALPKSPSRLRPDRHPARAKSARQLVLKRALKQNLITDQELKLAEAGNVPTRMYLAPKLARHLTRKLVNEISDNSRHIIKTTLDQPLQKELEHLGKRHAERLGSKISVAILVVENSSRRVLAYVGSSHFLDNERNGFVDMVQAIRSPGSTLKPFIYAMAFQNQLLHPQTIIRDEPTNFGPYEPRNFSNDFMGPISAAEALKRSLNIPAVKVLSRVGPLRFVSKLRRSGIAPKLPLGEDRPSLAVALGGLGVSLRDLVKAYAALADDGKVYPLNYLQNQSLRKTDTTLLVSSSARREITSILKHSPRPSGSLPIGARLSNSIAFKTGTSYGHRDAWAIGYNRSYTIGVWVGRPDGSANPGATGLSHAVPLVLQGFSLLPHHDIALPEQPKKKRTAKNPPPALQHFDKNLVQLSERKSNQLEIRFPKDNSEMMLEDFGNASLTLESSGGTRPLKWLIDGKLLESNKWQRNTVWRPNKEGYVDFTILDRNGQSASARVRFLGHDVLR